MAYFIFSNLSRSIEDRHIQICEILDTPDWRCIDRDEFKNRYLVVAPHPGVEINREAARCRKVRVRKRRELPDTL